MFAYDFDETIYDGDSTRDFYFYCLKKYPRILLDLPIQGWHFLFFALGLRPKTAFKEQFYRFFRRIPDMDKAVSAFWEQNFDKIKDWYLKQKRPDDVIISASPAFLLEIPCQRLGITPPIASRVDKHTGKYTGENCYGEEKPSRFTAQYPDSKIEAFFSDSLSDTPMAQMAEESFIVKGETRIPWKTYTPSAASRLKRTLLSPTFFRFLLVGVMNTAITTVLSVLYHRLIPAAVPAFALGYVTTNLLSFLMNCFFTFKKRPSVGRFLKFFLSYVPNFLIQCTSVWLLCDLCNLPQWLSYAAAAIIGVPVTYFLMKIFAFKK
ncbi:MAG: polysaccharide biosynthesis protein GtrA [Ruminococcaceae bacterium]|nr:polysaccharide biosynthesis protein GtrA [Oscillospiraceae bacterium]